MPCYLTDCYQLLDLFASVHQQMIILIYIPYICEFQKDYIFHCVVQQVSKIQLSFVSICFKKISLINIFKYELPFNFLTPPALAPASVNLRTDYRYQQVNCLHRLRKVSNTIEQHIKLKFTALYISVLAFLIKEHMYTYIYTHTLFFGRTNTQACTQAF